MTIKADKWIAEHSRAENYYVSFHLDGDYASIADVPLEEALSLAHKFNIPSFNLGFAAMCGPGNVVFEHNPLLLPLQDYITGLHGRRPHHLSFKSYGHKIRGGQLLNAPMIYPFVEESRSELTYRGQTGKCPSYGLSSYGYDIRLGNKFRVADGRKRAGYVNSMLDFLTLEDSPGQDHLFTEVKNDAIELLPGQFMLAVSQEWVNVPKNVMVTCMQKSTIARKGNLAFVTPLEPGWRGYITLEIANLTELPMRLYAGMGIMQLVFHQSDEYCNVNYADRFGKYMDQPAAPIMGFER